MLTAQEDLYLEVSPCSSARVARGRRTLQLYLAIRVFFYSFRVVLLVVFVVDFNNVSVRIVSWRIALQDRSMVAGMLDALELVSLSCSPKR
jgi:hypothetical protein